MHRACPAAQQLELVVASSHVTAGGWSTLVPPGGPALADV